MSKHNKDRRLARKLGLQGSRGRRLLARVELIAEMIDGKPRRRIEAPAVPIEDVRKMLADALESVEKKIAERAARQPANVYVEAAREASGRFA